MSPSVVQSRLIQHRNSCGRSWSSSGILKGGLPDVCQVPRAVHESIFMENNWHPDFEQAIGEAFGNHISPPIPFEDASPNECCEVLWEVLGTNFTPTILASLHDSQIELLATAFGRYFECE